MDDDFRSEATVRYLKVDSTRVSFAEYWRWKPGLPFLILSVRKLLRWRLAPAVLVPARPTLEIVDPQHQPANLVAALQGPVDACVSAGRVLAFWYRVPALGAFDSLAAALVASDGLSIVLVAGVSSSRARKAQVTVQVVSRLGGGRVLATGNGRSLIDPPPEADAQRLPRASPDALLEAHDARVHARRGAVLSCGDVREFVLELQRLQTASNLARGVFVTASPSDVERVERRR